MLGAELAADDECGVDRRTARPADEQAFLTRDPPRRGEGLGVGDHDRAVDDGRVVRFGPEVLTDALDEVRATAPAREHRALGVGADHLYGRVHPLEVSRDAGDGATRADARDEMRHPARRLLPDLGAGGTLVLVGVRLVVVLVRPVRVRDRV